MRTVWLTVLLVCATLTVATAKAAGAATEAFCPDVLLIESTNGSDYLASLSARVHTRASVDVTLYSKDAVYAAGIPNVDIGRPVPTIGGIFRSSAIVIKNPGATELLGATVRPSAGGRNFACPGENVLIPSVASLTAADRHVAPAADALEAELGSEAASAPIVRPLPSRTEKMPACDTPFADAAVDQLVRPDFPAAIRNDPNLQAISVRVELDSRGVPTGVSLEQGSGSDAADALALAAARRSTYRPARFACAAEPSSHVIRIDFSR